MWLGGAPLVRVVYWWVAFLVLTIAGERPELNRVLRPTSAIRAAFGVAAGLVFVGVVVPARAPQAGVYAVGAGLLVVTVRLLRHDIARRTVDQRKRALPVPSTG